MQFHEEFSTILDVKQEQNNLILRLDISDWFKVESYKNIVLELKLIKCQNSRQSFEEIKPDVGELVWTYEFLPAEKRFDIFLDNGNKINIVCEDILETKSDLTVDELFTKFQWLTESYQRESENGSKGWSKYQRLDTLLKTELEREIKNWETKKEFFARNETLNTAKPETIIKLCRKLLNFIGQVEEIR